jgi:hypothetical protein
MIQQFFSNAPWLQIAVAAIAYFVIGALWYSVLFQKAWIAGHNVQMTEEGKKKAPLLFAMSLVINFGQAIALAFLLGLMQSPEGLVPGLKVGLFVGLAFSAAPMIINYMYLGKSLKLIVIDAGYHVVGITVMSIIFSVWR